MKIVLGAILVTLVACTGGGGQNQAPSSMAKAGPAVVLAGRLTDQVTSLPLANVKVFVQGAHGSRVLGTAVTQADGTYSVAGLPTGVALHVVSQPVTSAVVYQTRVSGPITLAQGFQPGKVDLAFTLVHLGGAAEVQRPGRDQTAPASYLLLHKVALPSGQVLGAVVRTAPAPSGRTRFEGLPPGNYDLLYDRSTDLTGPHGGNATGTTWQASFTVMAGGTAHVNFGATAHRAAGAE